MTAPRAKTLQERMGYVDSDLKTPGHDAIMMWLDDMVRSPYGYIHDWLDVKEWSADDRSHGLDLPIRPGVRVTKTTWEYPVTTGREFTVGFIDLMVSYEQQEIARGVSAGRTIYEVDWFPCKAFFEVKTSIPSLGELLRQLTFYQQHIEGKMFVVSPDTRFAKKIREQGFGFVECPEPRQMPNGEWAIFRDPL